MLSERGGKPLGEVRTFERYVFVIGAVGGDVMVLVQGIRKMARFGICSTLQRDKG